MKLVGYSIALNFLLLIGGYFLFEAWRSGRADFHRVLEVSERNAAALEHFQTKDKALGSQVKVLDLRLNEMDALVPELEGQIDRLDVKAGRVQNASITGIQTGERLVTRLRDSVVFDTVPVKTFSYLDSHFRITGTIEGDQQTMDLLYQDTLVQTIYWGRRKHPWMWVFSRRQLEQRAALSNPNATITYAKSVQIKRR